MVLCCRVSPARSSFHLLRLQSTLVVCVFGFVFANGGGDIRVPNAPTLYNCYIDRSALCYQKFA